MKTEILRWPVYIKDNRNENVQYELIVFECGTCAIFNRSSYVAAHPDPASRLFGVVVEGDRNDMICAHLQLCGMVDFEIMELARDSAKRKLSRVERRWLDDRCQKWVRHWLEQNYPEQLSHSSTPRPALGQPQ
jgi:hypothetical protein